MACIGYGAGVGTPANVSGKVDFSQSKLEIGLRTDDPLTQLPLAIADGIAHESKTKFGINFALGISLGLDFFFKTPMADVIREAMDKGLADMTKTIIRDADKGTWEDAWETRILYAPEVSNGDTHFGIRGGTRAGVKSGDTFVVRNMVAKWTGAPCSSRLEWAIASSEEPLAEVIVELPGKDISIVRVVKYLRDERIEPGAQVKILALKSLATPTPTPAPRK